jgi:hypothetical protein
MDRAHNKGSLTAMPDIFYVFLALSALAAFAEIRSLLNGR